MTITGIPPKIAVIFHGKCLDGFTAAYAAWLKFVKEDGLKPDQIAFHPFRHDDPLPDVDGKDVYILDFSFPPATMTELARRANGIVLLDHHASAQAKLRHWACACARVKFDLEKSGARLAWEHFHPGQPAPAIVELVEDQDLHRFILNDSRAFNHALSMVPQEFDRWDAIANLDPEVMDRFLATGQAVRKGLLNACKQALHSAVRSSISGIPAVVVNAPPFLASDIGDLAGEATRLMTAVWQVNGENIVEVSLRASPDVLPVAIANGGGGNRTMSAFRMPLQEWCRVLDRETRGLSLIKPGESSGVTAQTSVQTGLIEKLCAMVGGRQSVRISMGTEFLVVNTQHGLEEPMAAALQRQTGMSTVVWTAREAGYVSVHGRIAVPDDVEAVAWLCQDLEFEKDSGGDNQFSGRMPLAVWAERICQLAKPDDATTEIHTRPMALV